MLPTHVSFYGALGILGTGCMKMHEGKHGKAEACLSWEKVWRQLDYLPLHSHTPYTYGQLLTYLFWPEETFEVHTNASSIIMLLHRLTTSHSHQDRVQIFVSIPQKLLSGDFIFCFTQS